MQKKPKQAELISDVPQEKLEKLGFQIQQEGEVDSHLISLVQTDRDLVRYALEANDRKIGRRLIVLDTVETTMNTSKTLAQSGQLRSGEAMIALKQTKGIGQNGRSWVSPRGNLHINVLFDTGDYSSGISRSVVFFSAIAISKAIRSFGTETQLKWVNDIVVTDGAEKCSKIGGILVKNILKPGSTKEVLSNVGIGVNLNTPPEGVNLDGFVTGVTTLREQTERPICFANFLDTFLKKLADEHLEIKLGSRAKLMRLYSDKLIGKSRQVRLHNDRAKVIDAEGTFLGINEDGQARIKTGRNTESSYLSGRLEIVR